MLEFNKRTAGQDQPSGIGSTFWRRQRNNVLLLAGYAVLLLIVSPFHEIWRDEAHVLNYAREATGVIGLFHDLRNEGHPGLWHLLVYFLYALFHSPLVLRAASIGVALAAVWVFLVKAPFPWWQKLLFMLGVLPLYEYSVISRSYGMSMGLLFGIAAYYPQRLTRPLLLAGLVFLLAQTNLHALIVAISITGALGLEYAWLAARRQGSLQWWLALLIACLGLVFSAWQIHPDYTSAISEKFSFAPQVLLNGLWKTLLLPGEGFAYLFGVHNPYILSILIWVFIIWCWQFPFAGLVPVTSVLGLGMLFRLYYPGDLRHQGFLLLIMVVMFWWDGLPAGSIKTWQFWPNGRTAQKAKAIILTLILLTQVAKAGMWIYQDMVGEYSSSRKFANFVTSNPGYHDAVILAEPDFLIEPMAYYLKNSFYIPRQGKFGQRISWSQDNSESITLAELLAAARQVQETTEKPVLLLLDQPITPLPDANLQVREYGYNKKFIYDNNMLREFQAQTIRLAEFRESFKENFTVYTLK